MVEPVEQSTVYEIRLPEPLSLDPDTDNSPCIIWNFTDPRIYSMERSLWSGEIRQWKCPYHRRRFWFLGGYPRPICRMEIRRNWEFLAVPTLQIRY